MISHEKFKAAIWHEIKYHQVRMASEYVKGMVKGLTMALEIGKDLNKVIISDLPHTIQDPAARILFRRIRSAHRRLTQADRKSALKLLGDTLTQFGGQ